MAVGNNLAAKPQSMENKAEFMVAGEKVVLTPQTVRDYLVSGDKERVSIQEIVMFINLCKYAGLNPWLKEAYCIKYGNEPATMVVGKEAFMKRAEKTPGFDGFEAGVIVLSGEELIYRKGTLKLPEETLVGGYAEVYRKDRSHSYRSEVSFEEYAARKKDGTLNSQWSKKPATMIRKVALVQALREAFPENFSGLYSEEEAGRICSSRTAGRNPGPGTAGNSAAGTETSAAGRKRADGHGIGVLWELISSAREGR